MEFMWNSFSEMKKVQFKMHHARDLKRLLGYLPKYIAPKNVLFNYFFYKNLTDKNLACNPLSITLPFCQERYIFMQLLAKKCVHSIYQQIHMFSEILVGHSMNFHAVHSKLSMNICGHENYHYLNVRVDFSLFAVCNNNTSNKRVGASCSDSIGRRRNSKSIPALETVLSRGE